jgi:hypothetical protein
MIWFKKYLEDLLCEPKVVKEDKTTAKDTSTESVKETIEEEVKNTDEEKIEENKSSFVEKVPLPSIKHEIDIDVSNAFFFKDCFRIHFFDKRNTIRESAFFYVIKNDVDNLKKGLIVTLQTYEKWCEFVKINGCTDGYDKELWSDTKSNLYIGVKYNDGLPKFYILQKSRYDYDKTYVIYFSSADEALVYCTEMFEKISLCIVQDEKQKQQNKKNDDFLDEYQKLLKATQNGLL